MGEMDMVARRDVGLEVVGWVGVGGRIYGLHVMGNHHLLVFVFFSKNIFEIFF